MKRPSRTGGPPRAAPRAFGFRHAARLVEDRVRAAGESRGFAVARLLTHWDEIVGPETARLAQPVKLGWGRGRRSAGLGATLTLETTGAAAPLVQMLAPQIRDRVNASLGHAAIARIALSQGAGPASAGFAEAQAEFAPAAGPRRDDAAEAARLGAQAAAAARGVQDPALRAALEALARNVLSRNEQAKGQTPPCNVP